MTERTMTEIMKEIANKRDVNLHDAAAVLLETARIQGERIDALELVVKEQAKRLVVLEYYFENSLPHDTLIPRANFGT